MAGDSSSDYDVDLTAGLCCPTDSNSDNGYVFEEGGVVLTWPAVSGAAVHDLYRSDNGSDFSKLTDFPLTDTTFTDKYGMAGHTYFYKYAAYDAKDTVIAESKQIKGKSQKQSDDKLADFYGAFKLIVPSSVVDGQGNVGTKSGAIAINQNGTYTWIRTYDGKTITGSWKATVIQNTLF